MKRERKRGGLWPVSRTTIGSGLPRTVLVLTLELLRLGQPLRPYKPYSGVRATERDKAGVFGSRGKKSTSSWSPRVQPAVECHLPQTLPARTPLARPGPALMWVQCRGSLAGRPCPAGKGGLPEPMQKGLCVAAARVPEDDWASPSICCERKSSFPASLASAYPSPAVLDQPIHHTDWCSPHQFSCSPCYPNLS